MKRAGRLLSLVMFFIVLILSTIFIFNLFIVSGQSYPVWCSFHNIHTTRSDGSMTPEQRVEAVKSNFDCSSTNDHDTALDQTEWTAAINEADSNNLDNNFTYFFGVEWSGSQHIHYITLNPSTTQKDAGDADFNEVRELASWLSQNNGIAQHNHPARTSGGTDFSNSANYNETWIPLVEMFNNNGQWHWNYYWDCAPGVCTTYTNPHSPPGQSASGTGWIKYALDKGIHLGFSGGDDYHGFYPYTPRVFTGIVNPNGWTREAVYQELKTRHTWAAEDRIKMDVTSGDKVMGEIFTTNNANFQISYTITAASGKTINNVSLFYDGVIVNVVNVGQEIASGSFNVNLPDNEEHYLFIEAIQNDGKRAWSSPMFVSYYVESVCGNNIKETGEDCDGSDLGGLTCYDLGYIGGNLSCNIDCTLNTASCIEDLVYPLISFVEPTPPSETKTENRIVEINTSVEEANLKEVIYNWNGISYSVYDDSLVLYFNFDNVLALGEGTALGDKVYDLSRNKNDGKLGNSLGVQVPIWTNNGKNNGAFTFETLDFNTDGDSILVKHDDSLNPGSGDFAVMLWINYDYSGDSDITRKGSTNTATTWYKVEVGGYSTPNLISLNFNTDGTDATLEDPTDYSDNKWHFVVAQRRGSQAELWIDGVKKKSGSVSGSISNLANLSIGSKDTQNDDFFNGTLDEYRIYINKSFSLNEINQLYMTNLYKYDVDKFALYIAQKKDALTELDAGTYTYFTSVKDGSGKQNTTEIRGITIQVPCGDGYCDGSIGENCNTCSLDCISGNFVICGDGICHGSVWGETCSSCPSDCISGTIPGGTCSACFKGKCDGLCNPTKESSSCADCNPSVNYCCGDGVCNGNENVLTCAVDCNGNVPSVHNYCCGDDLCEGNENINNCQFDCGCAINLECEDFNECTLDLCSILGICKNNPLVDNTICSSGICCVGICRQPTCSSDLNCADTNSCTIDICNNAGTCSASCSNRQITQCVNGDGCCPTGCTYSVDNDCPQATCSACWKGKCDGTCNPTKESSSCLDCA